MSVGEGRGAPSQACNKRGQERKEDEEFELGKLESSRERETMPPFLATGCFAQDPLLRGLDLFTSEVSAESPSAGEI